MFVDPLAHSTQRHKRAIKSYFADIQYRWRHLNFKTPPLRELVIYETHLPALSRHHSAGVTHKSHHGTYIGAMSPVVLNHLQRLNVAVEFLPLHANDQLLGQDWGYFSTSFYAMRECYAHARYQVNKEVMAMVDAMHGANLVHDVGYVESGLTGSYEMIVLTDELIAMADLLGKKVRGRFGFPSGVIAMASEGTASGADPMNSIGASSGNRIS